MYEVAAAAEAWARLVAGGELGRLDGQRYLLIIMALRVIGARLTTRTTEGRNEYYREKLHAQTSFVKPGISTYKTLLESNLFREMGKCSDDNLWYVFS